jgi:hypothetical protein
MSKVGAYMYASGSWKLWLCPLVLSGCALIGYDLGASGPSGSQDDAGISAASPPRGAAGGSAGGTAVAGSPSAGAGGTEGRDGGPRRDGAAPDAAHDAGPPDDACEGRQEGDSCDDGLYCVHSEVCRSGACVGIAKDCSSLADACHIGLCDEDADRCYAKPWPDGTSCGVGGICLSGACSVVQRCPADGSCTFGCTDGNCAVDCGQADECSVACAAGTRCNLDCTEADECTLACTAADCRVDCTRADNCAIACLQGSCLIECAGANHCEQVVCTNGATCTLDCTGANHCDFAACSQGGIQQCPDNLLVCNGPCPGDF